MFRFRRVSLLEDLLLQMVRSSSSYCILSRLVYKYKTAIYYLTEALEMGYYDASFELAKAHSSLARWHGKHGGLSIESFVRDLRFAKASFEHDLVCRGEDEAMQHSRDRLLKTLREAPEWIECKRKRLLKFDPNFVQGDGLSPLVVFLIWFRGNDGEVRQIDRRIQWNSD